MTYKNLSHHFLLSDNLWLLGDQEVVFIIILRIFHDIPVGRRAGRWHQATTAPVVQPPPPTAAPGPSYDSQVEPLIGLYGRFW